MASFRDFDRGSYKIHIKYHQLLSSIFKLDQLISTFINLHQNSTYIIDPCTSKLVNLQMATAPKPLTSQTDLLCSDFFADFLHAFSTLAWLVGRVEEVFEEFESLKSAKSCSKLFRPESYAKFKVFSV